MRLIILAILIYVLYKLLRGGEKESSQKRYTKEYQTVGEMVQDPECKIYIPMDQAHIRVINGKKYYFCSEKCANLFEKKMREEGQL